MGDSNKQTIDLNRLTIDGEFKKAPSRKGLFSLLLLVFIGLFLLGAAWVWRQAQREDVTLTEVRQRSSSRQESVLNASGYVTPRQRATVAARITGRVSELLIEEGMGVQKGQILARLDASDAVKELEAAEADLAAITASMAEYRVNSRDAQRRLGRKRVLFQKQAISTQDLEEAQTTLESWTARIRTIGKQAEAARSRVRILEHRLDDYIIRAPFSGIVVSKDAEIGEIVSPVSAGGGFTRTGIATIVDMDSLEIDVDVNESYIARVKVGQKAVATLDAYPDWPLPARVKAVIPTADRQKATVKVRISFEALDPKILPDMGIKVAFLEDRNPSDVQGPAPWTAKATAVLTEQGRTFVFVVQSDRVEKREIKVGRVLDGEIEILSGLTAGDRLVDQPSDTLKDGMRVNVQEGK